jgi:Chondroitinase B
MPVAKGADMIGIRNTVCTIAAACMLAWLPTNAVASEWVVAPGGPGAGTARAPFGSVQAALLAAQPGDTVLVRAGVYHEAIRTVRDGAADAPITLRAERGSGETLITTYGQVLQVSHSFVVVEGLVLDAAYAPHDAVQISSRAHSVVLRRVEVRRSSRDCINIGSTVDVLIEASLIHHCLNAAKGRTDAHGIVASAVHGLTVRDTEIHTFSGDAIQLNRQHTEASPAWDDVLIERCRLWLAPLPHEENGFPAGVVPGENAVDTKVTPDSPRARITIRDTEAWGFGPGLINKQAAFNLKEDIDATLDRVTVWDSEIAFRLRGSRTTPNGARVRIQNAVLHDVRVGVRFEDDIQGLRVWNSTFGLGVARAFEEASAKREMPDVRNVLILGATLPPEAEGASNLAVGPEVFVDPAAHDYRLTGGSPAVDGGTAIPEVTTDRAGGNRPEGRAYDVGAYEWCPSACASAAAPPPPTPGT